MLIKFNLKFFFSSFNLTIFLLGVLIFLIFILTQQSIKYFLVKNEIKNLEKEIKNLEEENSKMNEFLKYLKSDFYKEKEARLKFGFKKPDEKMIILVPSLNEENNQINLKKKESNLLKWLNYFLKK